MQITTKFTPGPWSASKLIGVDDLGIVNSYGSAVARIGNLDIANPANAHLIAAAPELYEALELVLDTYGFDSSTDSSIWQTVTAALAKARGEA